LIDPPRCMGRVFVKASGRYGIVNRSIALDLSTQRVNSFGILPAMEPLLKSGVNDESGVVNS
ncbi:MAG: hypothetical protein O7G85_16130, partial [Planctomycetota bacterium]|nr:hypothetical protein [Planctomycetota bacterium]